MKRTGSEPATIDLTVPKKPRQLHQTQLTLTARGPALVRGVTESVPLDWFTEALQQQMRKIAATHLTRYTSGGERRCAFNSDHADTLRVAYRDKYYEALVQEFMETRGSDAPVTTASFLHYWEAWHTTHAKLRLLCKACYQRVHPRFVGDAPLATPSDEPAPVITLQPYKGDKRLSEHEWLDIASWGAKSEKGNYSRLLDERHFTLFYRREQWHWAYNNKFSAKGCDRLAEVLRASYEVHKELIHRCCC